MRNGFAEMSASMAKSRKDKIGIIERYAIRSRASIFHTQTIGRAGRRVGGFQIKLQGQSATIKSTAQIGRGGWYDYLPVTAFMVLVFVTHFLFTFAPNKKPTRRWRVGLEFSL
jgi:hypothetical protein